MTIQACYALMGADYREVSNRLGTDTRIVKYLGKFMQDKSFSSLCTALERGEWTTAFSYAHNLKGLSLNLALTSLSRSSSKLCEALRGGRPQGNIGEMFLELEEDYQQMENAVSALLQGRENNI